MANHLLLEKLDKNKPRVTTRNGKTVIRIPMRLKRKSGRKRIILPEGVDGHPAGEGPVQQQLALAMAKGHRWRDLLEAGKFKTVAALAEAVELDPSYIRRHLRLTFMSPKMVEQILDGDEPEGVSMEKLGREIPLMWER